MFEENVLKEYLTQKIDIAGVKIDSQTDGVKLSHRAIKLYEQCKKALPEEYRELLCELTDVMDEHKCLSMRYCYLMGLRDGMGDITNVD